MCLRSSFGALSGPSLRLRVFFGKDDGIVAAHAVTFLDCHVTVGLVRHGVCYPSLLCGCEPLGQVGESRAPNYV